MKKTLLFLIISLFFFTACADNKEEVPSIEPTSIPTVEPTPTPTVEPTPTPNTQITGSLYNEFTYDKFDDFISYWGQYTENNTNIYKNIKDYDFNDIEYVSYKITGYCFDFEKHSNDEFCPNIANLTGVCIYYVNDSKYFELVYRSAPTDYEHKDLIIREGQENEYYLAVDYDTYVDRIVDVKFYGYSPEERAAYIEHIRTTIINSFN